MTDQDLRYSILSKYQAAYPDDEDFGEYIEYVNDMNRAELEFENTLIED